MAGWFELPAEVKQIIFSHVAEPESIIYVPRDRRRKVDLKHLNSHHFHDLLLVSKSFITPDEFAFAVLSRANLVFHSSHEQQRFITEVKPAVREAVRSILFARRISTSSQAILTSWHDSFEGFSNIPTTLSTQFPQLKHISIATNPYCANFGVYVGHKPPSPAQFDQMVAFILGSADRSSPHMEQPPDLISWNEILPFVVADCIANRNTKQTGFAWTRPVPWLRRLVQYAEEANIEIVFQVELCVYSTHEPRAPEGNNTVPLTSTDLCFSHRYRSYRPSKTWLMHVSSSMSTKDYLLRIEHDGVEYKFHQKLASDLLHAPASKGDRWWRALLREHGYRSWRHPLS